MTGETAGPIVGGLGLAAFAGAVVAIRAGALDAVVAAVLPRAGAVAVVAVAVWAVAARTGGRSGAGRAVVGHAHGTTRIIARHEAGHVAAARATGGRVVSATAGRGEGLVRAQLPSVQAHLTFLRAGRYAAGTSAGCSADRQAERAVLREVPRGERAGVMRDADADARRIVRQHRSQIQQDARTLEQGGSL